MWTGGDPLESAGHEAVLTVRASGETGLAEPSEVQALYRAASKEPPLREPVAVADLFANLYRHALTSETVRCVEARIQGQLIGFGYGHPWYWREQTDPWATELHHRLGDDAETLEDTFAISLLARDPQYRHSGIGGRVLDRLMAEAGRSCWLQTSDLNSPARRLYESRGFRAVGHGPVAPNGLPGLVMLAS